MLLNKAPKAFALSSIETLNSLFSRYSAFNCSSYRPPVPVALLKLAIAVSLAKANLNALTANPSKMSSTPLIIPSVSAPESFNSLNDSDKSATISSDSFNVSIRPFCRFSMSVVKPIDSKRESPNLFWAPAAFLDAFSSSSSAFLAFTRASAASSLVLACIFNISISFFCSSTASAAIWALSFIFAA